MNLTSMQADNNNAIPHMATGYNPLNKATTDIPDVGWRLPGGGFASNVYDLTRFMLGLINRQFLYEATSNSMWTAQTLENGTSTDFGLGVKIDESSGDLGSGIMAPAVACRIP